MNYLLRQLTLIALLGTAICQPVLAAFQAFVDRDQISTLETIRLTLRTDDTNTSGQPDFTALLHDFQIVSGPNQSSRTQIINGKVDSQIEFAVELKARRKGALIIPPIQWGQQVSNPIRIRVAEPTAAQKRAMNEFVYFETTVDADTIFVQSQLIYTVRFFSASSIDRDFIEPPAPADAVVRVIEGDRIYSTIVNNRRYYVLQKQYAIFPQKSGELIIEPETFVGQVREGGVFSRGRQVNASSTGHTITVKPKPANFPTDEWLPAESLSLTATWSSKPPVFKVGEPINLNLVLKAENVAASLLPPLTITKLDNAKVYTDPAQTDEAVSAKGISSTRIETIGIVPTKQGKLVIPEIQVNWWNTGTNRLQTATLPSSTYAIEAGDEAFAQPLTPPPKTTRTEQVIIESQGYWIYISAILALCWVLTAIFWWRARQQFRKLLQAPLAEDKIQAPNEKALFKEVITSCNANDPAAVTRTLLTWATTKWPDHRIRSVKDLHFLGDEFAGQINEMNETAYSPEASGEWNGNQMAALIERLRQERKGEAVSFDSAIQPLYP